MYNVLIVEDDPMVAMINRQFLSQNPNFQVAETTGDGITALNYLENHDVDLVILDVHMPRLSGLELLHRLREKNNPVAVVMVTAANDVATVLEATSLGAVDYLVKPFTYERFRAALQKFLAQRDAVEGMTKLSQDVVDHFISSLRPDSVPTPTPKGVQEKTLQALLSVLRESGGGWRAGDVIAEEVKLSGVTVRRYLNHLVRKGVVESRMDYETGGRPRLLYRMKEKESGTP